MFRSHCMTGLLALWLAALAPAARGQDARLFDYREIKLDNGLRVITLEDFSAPIVAVHLWYHVGSKNENPERQGFAHMFEHMMFRGTDRLGPTDHFDFIRRTGGTTNAYTAFDQTVYIQTIPANQLDMVLWLEAERMSFLKIDQEAFDTERKVVEEERRLGLNRPYGTVLEKALTAIFKTHPYRWSPIGNIPHLRSASVAELREFWTRYYVPNNATLVIVGAVKHEEAQEKARKAFGWIPSYPDVTPVTGAEPQPSAPVDIVIREDNAPAPAVAALFRTVPQSSDDAIYLQLLATILGGGESSRIYTDLVRDRELAMQAAGLHFTLELDGIFAAGAILSPLGGDTSAVMQSLEEHIARLRDEPVTADELDKARNQMLRDMVAENLTVESKATVLGQAAVLEGDTGRANRKIEIVRSATVADLQRAARQYLAPERLHRVTIERNLMGSLTAMLGLKKREEEASVTAAPETKPPAPGRPGLSRPADWPTAVPVAGLLESDPSIRHERIELENGMKVLVVENRELPFVTVQMGLPYGAWCESKPGSASLAVQMLTKGTEEADEAALAEELERHAISLGGSAGMDSSTVFASCLTEHTDRAVKLMADAVRRPTFPERAFERVKRQVLTGLAISTAEPGYVADRELGRRLFGTHPYARTTEGGAADVRAIAPSDASGWWKAYARPSEATLIFAGDIDKARAQELATKYFGDWRVETPPPPVDLPAIPKPEATRIYLVDYPGVQSQIRVGALGLTRKDAGYPTGYVVSNYFGGAFNARLNETIRVKKGLTYGARGGFDPRRQAGAFEVSTFTKNESTAEAVQAIFDELKRLRAEPPSEKELNDTKAYALGSFPRNRETPQDIAEQLWMIESEGLPADYYGKLLDGIAATTAEECVALVAERVDPAQMAVVVVGPAKELKAQLEKIAPVVVIESDDDDDADDDADDDGDDEDSEE